MVNTLQRRYENHLRDKHGYTGGIDTAVIDRGNLATTVDAIQRKIEELSVPYSGRGSKDLDVMKQEYAESVEKFRNLKSSLLEKTVQLHDGLDFLPDNEDSISSEDTKALLDLFTEYEDDFSRLNNFAYDIDVLRERIKQAQPKTTDEILKDIYQLTEQLFGYMGINDPDYFGVLVDGKVHRKNLRKLKKSAHWLITRLGKTSFRNATG